MRWTTARMSVRRSWPACWAAFSAWSPALLPKVLPLLCSFYILLKWFDSSLSYTELYEVAAHVKFYVVLEIEQPILILHNRSETCLICIFYFFSPVKMSKHPWDKFFVFLTLLPNSFLSEKHTNHCVISGQAYLLSPYMMFLSADGAILLPCSSTGHWFSVKWSLTVILLQCYTATVTVCVYMCVTEAL